MLPALLCLVEDYTHFRCQFEAHFETVEISNSVLGDAMHTFSD